jgi:hypothetical protein
MPEAAAILATKREVAANTDTLSHVPRLRFTAIDAAATDESAAEPL